MKTPLFSFFFLVFCCFSSPHLAYSCFLSNEGQKSPRFASETDSLSKKIIFSSSNSLIGKSNGQELLMKIDVPFSGNTPGNLTFLKLDFSGTQNLNDISRVKLYSTDTIPVFSTNSKIKPKLLYSSALSGFSCKMQVSDNLVKGDNYLWVVVGISPQAKEGNIVAVSVEEICVSGQKITLQDPQITKKTIIRTREVLFNPNDYGSKYYRIPAIITADDNSLVVLTDRRKFSEADLPQDIDLICNFSHDKGRSWSESLTIAEGKGHGKGFGDGALAHTQDSAGLIAVFVGGCGLWESTPELPIRSYKSMSFDNGRTWSTPEDITYFIYGSECLDSIRKNWKASFFGSGNGLLTSSGRIMFVAAIRESEDWSLSNYVVYSDDNGKTWQVSGRACTGGDESKVIELNDGRILMSIRHRGQRWYNISDDGGLTWQPEVSVWEDLYGPACNGDIIRYNYGGANCLLHSLPSGDSRKGVRVYASFDEGKTWPYSKCIVEGASAYSSLCVLSDGSIGLYVEEGENGYHMVFYNFSLSWLTNGNIKF